MLRLHCLTRAGRGMEAIMHVWGHAFSPLAFGVRCNIFRERIAHS